MSKKIKLETSTATIVLGYYRAVYAEGCVMYNLIYELMENLNLYENDEIYQIYQKIESSLFFFTKLNLASNLLEDLNRIAVLEGKYVNNVELRKFKIDLIEFPEKFKQDIINFYDKLSEIKLDTETVVLSKTKVLKSIDNIYFLVNRIDRCLEKIIY